jgi:predicted 3-demethylubiquinone-9 3-methyltransferase (glyoxalase superfamily)
MTARAGLAVLYKTGGQGLRYDANVRRFSAAWPRPTLKEIAMQKITTFLWFEKDAEDAIALYTSVFPNSRLVSASRYPEGGPAPAGTLMSATFELDGQAFMALNGGPHHPFNDAISLFVSCKDQAEVDHYWEALSAGGQQGPCGWLKDRFGVSWQIVPEVMMTLMSDPNPAKAQAVTAAMLQMTRLDIAALQQAYDNA